MDVIDVPTWSVARDVSCITCGYNMRTLRLDARCPECGKPVAASLRTDDLRFANVRWLRRVRRGVSTLLVAIVAFPLALFFILFFGGSPIPFMGRKAPDYFLMVALVAILVPYLIVVVGVFGITPPSRPVLETRMLRLARIAARVLVVLFVLSRLTVVIWELTVSPVTSSPLMYVAGLFCSSMMRDATLICLCIILRRLAQRGHNPKLYRWTTVAIWVVGFNLSLHLIAMLWSDLANVLMRVLMVSGGLQVVGLSYLAALFLLGWYRAMLTKAIAAAPRAA